MSVDKAINSVSDANNFNEIKIIKIQKTKTLRLRSGSKSSDQQHTSLNTANEFKMLTSDTEDDQSIQELPEDSAAERKTKRMKKTKSKEKQKVDRPLKPEKPAHETAPLENLTNVRLQKHLKADIREKYANVQRECECCSSSTKVYKTTQHQVTHILGKDLAANALNYEDYFNGRNMRIVSLPSYAELLEKLKAEEDEEDTESFPQVRYEAVRKAKPDFHLQVLQRFYKAAIEEMKKIERKAGADAHQLVCKEKSDRIMRKALISSISKVLTTFESESSAEQMSAFPKSIRAKTTEAPVSAFTDGDVTSEKTTTTCTSTTKSRSTDTDKDEHFMACLEEEHRNSQKALLSMYAIEMGKCESREFERLLNRFWAIYQSRSVSFNQPEFSEHTRTQWRAFAHKCIDDDVRRLKEQEEKREKYTSFLFPELKKMDKPSISRKASTYPGQFIDQTRIWGAPSPSIYKPQVDWNARIEEANAERKKIQEQGIYESLLGTSSQDKFMRLPLHQYAQEEFNNLDKNIRSTRNKMKRIGKKL